MAELTPTIPRPPSMMIYYVISVVGVFFAGIFAIVCIAIFLPDKDNTFLIAQVIGILTPTLFALLALIKSTDVAQRVEEVHLNVNSRLTQLLNKTEEAAMLTGELKGNLQGREESIKKEIKNDSIK